MLQIRSYHIGAGKIFHSRHGDAEKAFRRGKFRIENAVLRVQEGPYVRPALFQDFFEGKIDCVEINDLELESREIEVKE